jgi:hypothetical protein
VSDPPARAAMVETPGGCLRTISVAVRRWSSHRDAMHGCESLSCLNFAIRAIAAFRHDACATRPSRFFWDPCPPLKCISGGLERGREVAVLSVAMSNSYYARYVPGRQDSPVHSVPIGQNKVTRISLIGTNSDFRAIYFPVRSRPLDRCAPPPSRPRALLDVAERGDGSIYGEFT